MAPCGLCKDSIKYMWHTFFRRKATTSDITDMSAHTYPSFRLFVLNSSSLKLSLQGEFFLFDYSPFFQFMKGRQSTGRFSAAALCIYKIMRIIKNKI